MRVQAMFMAVTCVAVIHSSTACAEPRGLVVQAWHPEHASGLDWGGDAERLDELWNDCYLTFEMMCARPSVDTTPNRILVLWADGVDYTRTGTRYAPSRLRLDRIVDTCATVATIEVAFDSIGAAVEPSDTFWCYTWGHGGHDGPLFGPRWANHYSVIVGPIADMDSSFSGVELWDTTFARMADTVNCNRVFIMQQCFSGGFIDDLADSSTTMVCASAAGKKAWSADNDSRDGSPWPEHEVDLSGDTWRHVEFTFHFLNALRGEALAPYLSPDTQPRVADANHDGNVTLSEAFAYADSFDSQEQPVMVEAGAFWRVMPAVPFADRNKGLSQGGAASAVPGTSSEDTTRIYVLKGNRTDEFWAFFPQGDSWKQFAAVPQGPHGKEVSKGGTLAATLGRRAFVTKGNGTHEFWQFNGCSTWTRLADFPAGASGKPPSKGAAVAVVYDDTAPSLYYTRGFRTLDFLRYDPAFDSWTTCASVPIGPRRRKVTAGTAMTSDGDSTVFLLKGANLEFYAYDISGNTWSSLASLPKYSTIEGKSRKANAGTSLTYAGGRVYALKGGSRQLWVYDCAAGVWSEAQMMPVAPSGKTKSGHGAALVFADGFVYALKGNGKTDFYRFAPNLLYHDALPDSGGSPGPGAGEAEVAEGSDVTSPQISPDGEAVLYVKADTSGVLQLWKYGLTDSVDEQLTDLPEDCADPVWSPDGQFVAFIAIDSATSADRVAVLTLDDGEVAFLTPDSQDCETPCWSPDGGTIAYAKFDSSGYTRLYSVPAEGGEELLLSTESCDYSSPHYVSEGVLVYAREGTSGWTHIFKLNVNEMNETQLTTEGREHECPMAVPGYGAVAFETVDDSGWTQIGLVGLEGGERKLTTASADFESPVVCADGPDVYCVKQTDGGAVVCRVDTTTGAVYELTNGDVDRFTPACGLAVDETESATLSVMYATDAGVWRCSGEESGGGQGLGIGPVVLSRALPNPAVGRVKISWQVSQEARVSLKVYNTAGRMVRTLADGPSKPGSFTVVWNGLDDRGRSVPAGIYFYALESDGRCLRDKVVLAR